jgi:hypothetical protein
VPGKTKLKKLGNASKRSPIFVTSILIQNRGSIIGKARPEIYALVKGTAKIVAKRPVKEIRKNSFPLTAPRRQDLSAGRVLQEIVVEGARRRIIFKGWSNWQMFRAETFRQVESKSIDRAWPQ